MTKLEEIRQRKWIFEHLALFRHPFRMKRANLNKLSIGGVTMKNQEKSNKAQPKHLNEKKPGYGNKKLEGPDRPST